MPRFRRGRERGWDSLLVRLRDPATRRASRRRCSTPPTGRRLLQRGRRGSGILITGVFQDSLRSIQGKRISEIAAARHRDPIETIFDIVVAEGGHRTDAVYFLMSEPDVQTAMKTCGWP